MKPPSNAAAGDPREVIDTRVRTDRVLVQCWLFGLELCAGASVDALCRLLDAEWPEGYRPQAMA